MNLVIVESPTKAKTISRFLGKDYIIKASMGHLVDLPKSKLGVEVEDNFAPQYEIIEDKKDIIADLKSALKKSKLVILATDPDREGEAIAYNVKDILLDGKKTSNGHKFERIVFHEITEDAIKDALEHPRDVDENLVNAQTARRVLDRLVGYKLSPLLWQKVRRGLSAGRVQSVALRLIVEREKEIEKFAKEPYYTIHALLHKQKQPHPTQFDLIEIDSKKIETSRTYELYDGQYSVSRTTISKVVIADELVEDLKKKSFVVSDVLEKEAKRTPNPPFTTSTLQQEASRRFGFSGKRTMSLAQKLYEEGYITYHRTDSVTLSTSAVNQIRSFVKNEFGDKYVPEVPRAYTAKQKLAQEAHEGIRPTKFFPLHNGPHLEIEKDLGREYAKIYELIWRRAVASQMEDARIESTTVLVDAAKGTGKHAYRFKATGSVLIFDGFLKINPQALMDNRLPRFEVGEHLISTKNWHEEHETSSPPRYNEASIIATLEEKGIGRPSTYASIISTLVDRAYVERVDRRFVGTPVGMAVNDFLVTNFSDIDDIPFTAEMEDDLDNVASGKKEWVTMMKQFYSPFSKKLGEVKDAKRVKIEAEMTDEICPECKKHLVIRIGKFGKFLSCEDFPNCKFSKQYVEQTNLVCPKDKGTVIVKKTRKGRKFYGCSNYPNCDFAAWKIEDILQSQKGKKSKANLEQNTSKKEESKAS